MQFETVIANAWPPDSWSDTHVIAAVSGGADSCALLAALVLLKPSGRGEIVAAHFNHGLRGAAAEADAAFVQQFGESLGVRVVVGRGDVTSAGDGVEAAARAARYQFLLETALQCGARYLATAHTADDQVETVLHRILRGTGISGLAGMRAARPLSDSVTLVRPMLNLARADVVAYLSAHGIAYREDETNAELRFTRNRLRRDLLPRLRDQYNPDVDAALLRLAQLAGENQTLVEELVARLYIRATQQDGDREVVSSSALVGESRYLVRELFVEIWQRHGWPQQAMGFAQWDALAELLSADGQRIFPGNIQATKKGEQLTLTRL